MFILCHIIMFQCFYLYLHRFIWKHLQNYINSPEEILLDSWIYIHAHMCTCVLIFKIIITQAILLILIMQLNAFAFAVFFNFFYIYLFPYCVCMSVACIYLCEPRFGVLDPLRLELLIAVSCYVGVKNGTCVLLNKCF